MYLNKYIDMKSTCLCLYAFIAQNHLNKEFLSTGCAIHFAHAQLTVKQHRH